jgi:hypothetical protein
MAIQIDDMIKNDTDVVEESHRSTESEDDKKWIRYWDLSFQTPEEQIEFMRNRAGKEGDLQDKIIYV